MQQVGNVCVGRSCDHYLFHLGTLPVSLDSEPSLQHLMEKVAAVIPSKCWAVGFQLGLTTAELQAICPHTKAWRTTTEHLVRYLMCGGDEGRLLTPGGH